MVGSGIVTLPWAFGQSGFLLGLVISLVGLFISFRTTILMIRAAGNDKEYFDTLYKYWGKWAYYSGHISTLLIILAAITAYFIILSQMLYFLSLALLKWIFKIDLVPVTSADFSVYSLAYTAIFVFVLEFVITLKKDLSIFIRLISFGSIFIIAIILFIVGFGFYSFTNTHFVFVTPDVKPDFDPDNPRQIRLYNIDFSPLAGTLGIGYFLHTLSLPIIKNNAKQENNERDVFLGYALVGITYISVGLMGSFGFMGTYFDNYYSNPSHLSID